MQVLPALCFVFLSLFAIYCEGIPRPLIHRDQSIAFVGDSHVMYGSVMPFGFLYQAGDIFRSLNITVEKMYASSLDSLCNTIRENFSERDIYPNLIVVLAGTDDVYKGENDLYSLRSKLGSVISLVSDKNATVILATPFMIGESVDGNNNLYQEVLGEYKGVVKHYAKEFQFRLLDVHSFFAKALEKLNSENLELSVLTFDGYHLNERGHGLLKSFVLSYLGLSGENTEEIIRSQIDHRDKRILTYDEKGFIIEQNEDEL